MQKNLSLNMPKNVLLSLKNCKNLQTLGALPPYSLTSDGWGLGPQTPTSVILHCESSFCIRQQSTDSFEINIKIPYLLVIITGVHQDFCIEKIMLHFVCHRLHRRGK